MQGLNQLLQWLFSMRPDGLERRREFEHVRRSPLTFVGLVVGLVNKELFLRTTSISYETVSPPTLSASCRVPERRG